MSGVTSVIGLRLVQVGEQVVERRERMDRQAVGLPDLLDRGEAVHPDGEVAVARAAVARGTVIGLSNFASKSVEEVTATGAATFFQMYWTGDRDVMVQRMERARDAGAIGLIATLDWSFSTGRDWGSPEIPEKVDLMTAVRMAPKVVKSGSEEGAIMALFNPRSRRFVKQFVKKSHISHG